MKRGALANLVADIKADTKAQMSAADMLEKLIDDYCKSGKFRAYLQAHRGDAGLYLEDESNPPGRFRASSAGKCLQQQAFKAIDKTHSLAKDTVTRTAENERALHNGTFTHVRWHMLFDALHEIGSVRTVLKEVRAYDEDAQITGALDRLIEFEFEGETIRAVLDFKSIKSFYFGQLVGPEHDHEWQQYGYKLLKFEADWWFMLYEDKDTHKLKIYQRRYPEGAVDELRARYALANQWVDGFLEGRPVAELPTLEINTKWCGWCPFQTICLTVHPGREKAAA